MTSANTATTPEQVVADLIDTREPTGELMLTVDQVAKVLGVTARTVLYLLQDNRLSYIATGKRSYRIPRVLLTEYLLESFVPRQVAEAEETLAQLQQAIQDSRNELADLAVRIAMAKAELTEADIPTQRRRSTQTVS
ncbi:excisionase family DNA-binding protein [Streptosporangium lutulentum]|uniref:Excisionase family DNA binding protein n=1 Tax=Streptosporangium lutulentum TaxID=1461250 RepID=A0ABT9Q994_9ACTN|nr:excisionase family DNA-binding protein [Streptosporangium lutulentum]MDP9843317.1 excisionase family DNA binding protein [Streptosporangium lutulentum]